MPEQKPALSERELIAIVERAHNPLIPIEPYGARKDLQALVAYIKELRTIVAGQQEDLTNAQKTMAALALRGPNGQVRVAIADVASIQLGDHIHHEDVTEDGVEYRVFTYIPKQPRVIQ